MTTITEDYISFETAKLLKEKGFDNISSIMYKENGEICVNPKSVSSWRLKCWYPCLTLQMAMKWLRKEHKVNIEIHYNRFGENYNYLIIYKPEVLDDIRSLGFYSYYEDAAEAAIKYCLENLI